MPRLALRPTRREPLLIQPLHLLRICVFRIRVILALIRIIHRLTRRDIITIRFRILNRTFIRQIDILDVQIIR